MISKKNILLILFLFIIISCEKDDDKEGFSVCNNILVCDGNGTGEYCTFGYKWGAGNPFSGAGLENPGPSLGPVTITYKFQNSGFVFNTHSQENITSLSFDNLNTCVKEKIREALAKWEAVADIEFIETAANQESDIKIIIADIKQGGLGYPNYPDAPCSEIAGLFIIKSTANNSCEDYYSLALHEIGHVLGLGHVKSNNVMNPNKIYHNLQPGDITGIQSIYGEK